MIKIVYLTDQVYLHGGLEKVLAQKLNYFANCSEIAEVHLITTEQKNKKPCYAIDAKVIQHDLAINYHRAKSYFHPINFLKVPKHIQKVKKALKEIQPDVLIVCNYAFDFYFIPFITNGIKTIKEYHSSRYYYIKELPKAGFFQQWLFKLNTLIEQKYTYLVVLNAAEQQYYKSSNVQVIPNAIQLQKSFPTTERKKIILAAGRIAPVKQFDQLIKAWSVIENQFPDWEVHIYGDGDDRLVADLTAQMQELKLSNIFLKGATDQLPKKMQEASIYAMTSQTECFPMVLLEALSVGLPIISYDCPHGPATILNKGEVGLLVPPNEPETFAKKMAEIIKNKEQRDLLSIAGRRHVLQYSEEIILQKWLHLFQKPNQ